MGRRGPQKTPAKLRLLHGESRPSHVNLNEPAARIGIIDPPPGMSAKVRAVWDAVIAELEAMDLAFPSDMDVLRCYCEAVVVHRRASELLAQSDIMIKGIMGGPVRNPLLAIQRDSAHSIRQFSQEFGLSPAARTGISMKRTENVENNPFAGSG